MLGYKRGSTSIILRVKILDSASVVGAGKTGLTFSSSGLIISTIASTESTATAYTQAGSTTETITTLGTYAAPTATKCRFKEVDATNHPGLYEIQIADARFAVSSAKNLIVSISGASGVVNCDILIPLLDFDPYDAVRAGLTALPNAIPSASGGLFILGGTLTENYIAQGAALTLDGAIYNIHQMQYEKSISGTSLTVKKRNGSTTAKTGTLNSATTPSAIVEAT